MSTPITPPDFPTVIIIKDNLPCHLSDHVVMAGDTAQYFSIGEDPDFHLLMVKDPAGNEWLVKVHSTWFEAAPQ